MINIYDDVNFFYKKKIRKGKVSDIIITEKEDFIYKISPIEPYLAKGLWVFCYKKELDKYN